MGQNQLLLLVLGILVVGLGIGVGIRTFADASRRNQADDVLNRNIRIAQEAVSWRAQPDVYGGGGSGSYDALATLGLSALEMKADLAHTEHAVLSASGETLEIVGVSSAAQGVGAYVRVEGNEIAETKVSLDGGITLSGVAE